jgi:hypothetical protein
MRILLDVDGVIADFVGALCRRLNEGVEYDGYQGCDLVLPEMIHTLRLEEFFANRQYREVRIWNEILANKGEFCKTIKSYGEPYGETLDGLAALRSLGEVIAITSPWSPDWYEPRVAFLRSLGFANDQIVFCPSPQKRFFDGDVLVEDTIETACDWCGYDEGYDGAREAFVMRRPWNSIRAVDRDTMRDHAIEYVDSLIEVANLIR